jgi:hypothetical protein
LVRSGANVNAANKVRVMSPARVRTTELHLLHLSTVGNGTHALHCLPLLWPQNGKTPIHRAVEKGHDTIVEALVRVGADVNATDKVGVVCLPCALYCDSLCIVGNARHSRFALSFSLSCVGRFDASRLGCQQWPRQDCGDAQSSGCRRERRQQGRGDQRYLGCLSVRTDLIDTTAG